MASSAVLQEVLTQGREKQLQNTEAEAKMEWVRTMRKQFSPPDMLTDEGNIKQDFFKPTQIVVMDDKKWGPAERDLLYQGLEKHGVGKWREISTELLPRWDEQALRIKAAKLVGSQSLARYVGWKGSRAAVEAEYDKNKVLGERLGCWKGGVLVEDDNGSVKKALAILEQ